MSVAISNYHDILIKDITIRLAGTGTVLDEIVNIKHRVNKNRGYTVMANFHLRDKSLSLKAVGLLSKMLSFNDGWKFSTNAL